MRDTAGDLDEGGSGSVDREVNAQETHWERELTRLGGLGWKGSHQEKGGIKDDSWGSVGATGWRVTFPERGI